MGLRRVVIRAAGVALAASLAIELVACGSSSSASDAAADAHPKDAPHPLADASTHDAHADAHTKVDAGADAKTLDAANHDATQHDSGTGDAGHDATGLVPTQHGVYAVFVTPTNSTTVLASPFVDGVSIQVGWADVDPDGGLDWAPLDKQIAAAADAGKLVTVAVSAGSNTPSWVYAAGATKIHFMLLPSANPVCTSIDVPVPWDPKFLAPWEAFVAALGQHLQGNPAIVAIKVTGINSDTAETQLARNTVTADGSVAQPDSGECVLSNGTAVWDDAGYSVDAAVSSWTSIADAFLTAFPDTALDIQLVPNGFPPFKNGNTTGTSAVLAQAETILSGRLVVQSNGLKATTGSVDQLVEQASRQGLPTGYQMYDDVVDETPCAMDGEHPPSPSCDGGVLLGAVDVGIDAGAHFLEIYAVDIVAYGSDGGPVAYAHRELTQGAGH
jgi:hypothetical protein